MAKILNFQGWKDAFGGSSAAGQGAAGQRPTFGNYRKTRDWSRTGIKAGQGGFQRKLSEIEFRKRLGGKRLIKTKDGYMTYKDMRQHVAREVGKASGGFMSAPLTGERLKKKLRKDLGVDYKDAERIAKAATYDYAKPPDQKQVDPKEVKERIRQVNESSRLAGSLQNAAAKGLEKRREDSLGFTRDASSVDIVGRDQQRTYGISALSGKQYTEADTREKAQASIGDISEGAEASIAESMAKKKKQDKKNDNIVGIAGRRKQDGSTDSDRPHSADILPRTGTDG